MGSVFFEALDIKRIILIIQKRLNYLLTICFYRCFNEVLMKTDINEFLSELEKATHTIVEAAYTMMQFTNTTSEDLVDNIYLRGLNRMKEE